MADPKDMYRCPVSNCGYVYDPDRGDKRRKIPAGTRFEDLPEDWTCPVCGASKKNFKPLSEAYPMRRAGREPFLPARFQASRQKRRIPIEKSPDACLGFSRLLCGQGTRDRVPLRKRNCGFSRMGLAVWPKGGAL